MKVSAPDGVKIYNISSGESLPQWLSESKKKSLKKNDEYRRRIELVQDLKFPTACTGLKVTPDQQYLFATGLHPPMVKVYDLGNLSLKFDRHLDAEVVDFQILSEDYSKAVFLCSDRTLCFHARFGSYYKLRVPKFCRDLAYVNFLAELMVVGSAPEVYRVSLTEGRFMAPLATRSSAINAIGVSPVHGLTALAGEDGFLECLDPRQRTAVGLLPAARQAGAPADELTAVRFDDLGLHVAVGTSSGQVAVFDLRSQRPLVVKDHMYGSKIIDIKFHNSPQAGASGRRVISSDSHIIKIWDVNTGKGYTNVEPKDGDIHDVCVWKDSGLILAGCDTPKVQSYFIPSLGPAPKWCGFLEGLTEELEETTPTIYDDYRFVTKSDLHNLGLDHLMGTSLLRAYMHGFFIDHRLYKKAKDMMEPFAYETYRQQRIQKKLEEERQARISKVKKLPKVNAKVAARLLADDEDDDEGGERKKKRKGDVVMNPMEDERFKVMFEEEDFAIDEESQEYKLLHPNVDKPSQKSRASALVEEHFEQVSDEEEEEDEDDEEDSEDSLDEMDEAPRHPRSQGDPGPTGKPHPPRQEKSKRPKLYAAKDEETLAAFRRRESLAERHSRPLGERVRNEVDIATRSLQKLGGNRELVFTSGRGGKGRGGGRDSNFRQFDGGNEGRGRGRGTGRGTGRGRRGGSRGRGRGRR